ncbi:mechanosensitive ion channel domain-containing protein [Lignipirellula cremea]|uniref:mechanosensitive ion channel domain-containing protein n=1 Tax=Lignipirellula cremea TaxID=2528010 RepID=UPI001E33D474|nr:mechanosensitive ion channel domain-containing protein [Lignipirellula cremea]
MATFLPRDVSQTILERVGSETDRMFAEVNSQLAKTRRTLEGRPSIRMLQRAEFELSEMLADLRSLEEQLDDQLDALGTSVERIDSIAAVWQATDELARTQADVDATTTDRIAAVRSEIEEVRSTVVKRRNDMLAVRDKLVNPSVALNVTVEHLQSAVDARLAGIFHADHPPLWNPQVRESIGTEWQTVGLRQFLKRFDLSGQDSRRRAETLGLQFILLVGLGLMLRWVRNRTRARAEDDSQLRHAQLVFEHPWAMAVLMTGFFAFPIHTMGPRSAGPLAAALIAAATLRIVLRFLPSALATLAWGLAVLFTIDRARDLLDATPTLERVVFLGEMVAVLGLLIWLLRPSGAARLPEEHQRHPLIKLLYHAMRVGAGFVTLAILADLTGWTDLAVMLGDGVMRCGYLGLFVFVLLKVFHGLATFALVLRPLRLSRTISNHRRLVDHRLGRILNVIAVAAWAVLVCGQLGLLVPAKVVAGRVLCASVTIGALSVSVADVLVFALTVWLSFLLARLLQAVLHEDVFSRVRTARGVPYAVSSIAKYSVIFLGFLVGLSAAGIEITKLAVVAGGLGVGIGFGLQNIVNNFVSGLILLFERPIDVGDTIEFSGNSGTMQRIGIRASLIRTFDGAEVIVPNGMLISESVTNWTLSDRCRRIDLTVGVEYGTPAQRVIDLLVEVAKANPKVIPEPESQAFFENFGDSSLDFRLRAWIDVSSGDSADTRHVVLSEIAVAVQQALDEAGIGVPFPQRDLRLISMPPNAASELGVAKPQADAGQKS